MFHVCLCDAVLSVPRSFVITCLEGLTSWLSGVLSFLVFFPYGISGQVWYLILSIPDLYLLLYYDISISNASSIFCL